MGEWQPIDTAPKDGRWIMLRGGVVGGDSDTYPDINPPAVVAKWIIDHHPHYATEIWGVAHWDSDWRTQYENPTEWREIPA